MGIANIALGLRAGARTLHSLFMGMKSAGRKKFRPPKKKFKKGYGRTVGRVGNRIRVRGR